MDILTKEVHMFFFKPTPEKLTKWFSEGVNYAKFTGRKFTDELQIEIDGYQVAFVDKSIGEDYEIPNFFYDRHVHGATNSVYVQVKFNRIIEAYHIDYFTKKSIMIDLVSNALYELERRRSLLDEANKMSEYRNAGFNIVSTQYDFFSTTSILLFPKDLDSYVNFCQKYMEGRIETGYPFDAIAFRADLIDQFARAATTSNDSDMVICGNYPPIHIDTVVEWYTRYVERKKREESIARINSTCQKTVDQIQARYNELIKYTSTACGSRTRHAG